MGLAIGIIIVCIIIGCAVGISKKQKENELAEEGKILKRKYDFMEKAEEFTLTALDPDAVAEAVKAMDYNDMHVSMKGNIAQQQFQFSGGTWTARLYKLSGDDTQSVYRFEFTGWKSGRSGTYGITEMNKLITGVEKMFLSFDSNTQVKSVQLKLKTGHIFVKKGN